jgi:Mce-associated membrane protein
VEDQPADAGGLTDRDSASGPAGAVVAPADEAAEVPAQGAEKTSVEDAAAEAEHDSVSVAVAARRGGVRRWFRRRPPATSVTAGGAAETVTTTESDKDAAEQTTGESDARTAADDESSTQGGEERDEEDAPPPKPAGRVVTGVVAAAAVMFVGAGAFAGAMLQPYLADKALVDTKLEIARTAANAITTLWTYTPDNMDSLPDRSAKFLGSDFEAQYRKYIDAISPVNKQAKVTNSTQVVGAAVESLNGQDATAVVYTNTSNSSPQSNNIPSLQYLSYRLIMQRHDARWLITKMTTITSVNLTPKLG